MEESVNRCGFSNTDVPMSPKQYRLLLECIFSFYTTTVPQGRVVAEKIRLGLPAEIDVREIPDIKLVRLNSVLRTLSRDPRIP